ncbi:NADPH-dependent F420 reductase [Mesorhizobium sp. Root552]|uniref:NADPH-dependent F420 reductase n=1 Tax=Mesorhizobium sp. Root552 TaxID=1736555 RepID=UPI0006FDC169|nr:NADPH-dependent F420 reductase [Mesorhizobium sp. Root552]KQZ22928.1 NADPH-dependent F420 reductase [Mesorhizobium sp. Root552]
MTIAIIGTGNMAKGLAGVFSKAGYPVTFGSRDAAKASEAARELGGNVSGADIASAAGNADVVVLAVPFDAAGDAIAAAGELEGKIVIDITNPLTADYSSLTIGHSTSAAEEIQKLAPKAKVVKAFNTIFASVLQAGGKIGDKPATVFIAGDQQAVNDAVEAIAAKSGFVPVQVGGLSVARYLEPVAGLNIVLGYMRGFGTDIAPTWQTVI